MTTIPYVALAADGTIETVGTMMEHDDLDTHLALVDARRISDVDAAIIGQNPQLWRYDGNRLLPRPPDSARLDVEQRSRRNLLLTASDWIVQASVINEAQRFALGMVAPNWSAVTVPLDATQLAAWNAYRQSLRDLPAQNGFPVEVSWPTPPVSVR